MFFKNTALMNSNGEQLGQKNNFPFSLLPMCVTVFIRLSFTDKTYARGLGEKTMKSYTWDGGKVVEGIILKNDEKLGQVIFLGEQGPRRYEKISLGRRNPAQVVNNKVVEAAPVRITLPAKDGKPEKVFFVLDKPRSEDGRILVRVNTSWCYTKHSGGGWFTLAGTPETLIKGYGAHGIAGRIGNWDDGLVTMKTGDVLKVKPEGGHKVDSFALWVDENDKPQTATLEDWENLQAVGKAEAMLAEAKSAIDTLPILHGEMPCFTFKSGEIQLGIQVEKGVTGLVVKMGEDGRGASSRKYRLSVTSRFRKTASHSRRSPSCPNRKSPLVTVSTSRRRRSFMASTHSAEDEKDTFLVHVNTGGGYTRRGDGYWETWKGNPEVITFGSGADGDAGRIGSWKDGLIVLREEDVMFVHPSGGGSSYALFIQGGKIHCEKWMTWKMSDGPRNPQFYVGKGTAPWGHTPSDWIGKVVTILEFVKAYRYGDSDSMETRQTGELVSTKPFVLNLGYDGRDTHNVTVKSGTWVKLEADKQVRQMEGEELAKRQELRTEAEALRKQADEATSRSYFQLLESNLREQVSEVAREQDFDLMPNEGWGSSLTSWVENAKGVIARFTDVSSEMAALEQKQNSGEVLVDFGGHFRVMGATSQAQYWVVRPDGTQRDPDTISYRKRYSEEGDKQWRQVEPDELAISWFKAYTAADHDFVVNKAPVGGCTIAQLETVDRLEAEIAERWEGMSGISGSGSPRIDIGWGLGSSKSPARANQKREEAQQQSNSPKVDLSSLDALKQKWGAK